jgi:hypothetical protein
MSGSRSSPRPPAKIPPPPTIHLSKVRCIAVRSLCPASKSCPRIPHGPSRTDHGMTTFAKTFGKERLRRTGVRRGLNGLRKPDALPVRASPLDNLSENRRNVSSFSTRQEKPDKSEALPLALVGDGAQARRTRLFGGSVTRAMELSPIPRDISGRSPRSREPPALARLPEHSSLGPASTQAAFLTSAVSHGAQEPSASWSAADT